MKTNNNDQRGITHHLMLIGLAVIVAGAIGFAGFRIYKSKNDISAKAAGWTRIGSSTLFARACKTGNGTETKVYYSNYTSYPATMDLRDLNGNGVEIRVNANSNSYVYRQYYYNSASLYVNRSGTGGIASSSIVRC